MSYMDVEINKTTQKVTYNGQTYELDRAESQYNFMDDMADALRKDQRLYNYLSLVYEIHLKQKAFKQYIYKLSTQLSPDEGSVLDTLVNNCHVMYEEMSEPNIFYALYYFSRPLYDKYLLQITEDTAFMLTEYVLKRLVISFEEKFNYPFPSIDGEELHFTKDIMDILIEQKKAEKLKKLYPINFSEYQHFIMIHRTDVIILYDRLRKYEILHYESKQKAEAHFPWKEKNNWFILSCPSAISFFDFINLVGFLGDFPGDVRGLPEMGLALHKYDDKQSFVCMTRSWFERDTLTGVFFDGAPLTIVTREAGMDGGNIIRDEPTKPSMTMWSVLKKYGLSEKDFLDGFEHSSPIVTKIGK